METQPVSHILKFTLAWLFGLNAITLVVPHLAYCEYIPPSSVVVRTKAYSPQETRFPRGVYEYSVSWEGIPVGSARVEIASTFREGRKFYDVEATARSASVVSLFYRLQHRSESVFSADKLTPREFHSRQTENSKFVNVDVHFEGDGKIQAKAVRGKKNAEPAQEEIDFHSDNATFDPISAAFVARSLPINPDEDLSFDVFNGKHRYLISFHVIGRENVKVAGKIYDAFKVEPSVKKLTDTQGEQRLRKVYLWVSADESREVLKLESEVFIGKVNAKLVRFTPDTSPEPELVRARLETPRD